jgi:hypothetical protein
MEMKFIIQKYSQVFDRVGTGYRELTKFHDAGDLNANYHTGWRRFKLHVPKNALTFYNFNVVRSSEWVCLKFLCHVLRSIYSLTTLLK